MFLLLFNLRELNDLFTGNLVLDTNMVSGTKYKMVIDAGLEKIEIFEGQHVEIKDGSILVESKQYNQFNPNNNFNVYFERI